VNKKEDSEDEIKEVPIRDAKDELMGLPVEPAGTDR
jgi:hypothetical protein